MNEVGVREWNLLRLRDVSELEGVVVKAWGIVDVVDSIIQVDVPVEEDEGGVV